MATDQSPRPKRRAGHSELLTISMQVIDRIDSLQLDQDTVLTIGIFDGIHRGHQHLLDQLLGCARQTRRLSVVLTFHPHPRIVLGPGRGPGYLSTPTDRTRILSALGVELLVLVPFTRRVADMPAQLFVAQLHNRLCFRDFFVGSDFALGHDRTGDIDHLRRYGDELGYRLHVVQPLVEGGEPISSTRIRRLLQQGRMGEANDLLGYPYSIAGHVVKGEQRGRRLGFRTANLIIDAQRATPANGVYAVWAELGECCYPAVVNVGVRPSFGGSKRLIEVHLIDFDGDLYGRRLTISFVKHLRPEQRFEEIDALINQVRRDVEQARAILSASWETNELRATALRGSESYG